MRDQDQQWRTNLLIEVDQDGRPRPTMDVNCLVETKMVDQDQQWRVKHSSVGLGLETWSSLYPVPTENKDNTSTVGLGLPSWSSRTTVGLGLPSWSSSTPKKAKEHL